MSAVWGSISAPGGVLRAERLERLRELDAGIDLAQALLDRQLGLEVLALAVVDVAQQAAAVEQVAARPALVPVEPPDLQARVERHGVRHLEPLGRAGHRVRVAAERVAGGCAPDHLEPGPACAGASAQVGERAQGVHAREVPELDQDAWRPRRRPCTQGTQ